MALSLIAHDNALDGATIDLDGSEVNFPASNLSDGRTNTQAAFTTGSKSLHYDLGLTASINYIAFAKHNIFSLSGSIEVYYSTNDGSTWNLVTTVTPASDGVGFVTFSTTVARWWRLVFINHTSTVYLSNLAIGSYLQPPIGMPIGFSQPRWGDQDEIRNNLSRSNDLVGVSVIERPKKNTILFKNIASSWFDSNWDNFIADVKKRPFFFLWSADRTSEAYFCWPTKKNIPAPRYTKRQRCTVNFDVEGFV